ncbi:hypothetical protein OPV22_004204 [Ensete ventricosum]|uniref:Uncharacterized protein n=1 Tax=Ensete ventricosum TaxID=4639 RepID=A0AAV8S330_ENSVE|nr:hypothetical protein OPV22_004204 [Ensete ventricosum]
MNTLFSTRPRYSFRIPHFNWNKWWGPLTRTDQPKEEEKGKWNELLLLRTLISYNILRPPRPEGQEELNSTSRLEGGKGPSRVES